MGNHLVILGEPPAGGLAGLCWRERRRLWAYLLLATGRPDVADDLLGDAYLRCLEADQGSRAPEDPWPMARHLAHNWRRATMRHEELISAHAPDLVADGPPDPLAVLCGQAPTRQAEVLARVASRHRPILRHLLAGQSMRALARRRGISIRQASSLVREARRAAQQVLASL